MVSLVTDITEQKKAQKERERLEAQLRQAQKMEAVGTLAGGIAHDFRNILQAIFGYCDILMLDLREGEKGYEEIREIQKAASRASELTQQLLTFSRKVESKLRPVNLNDQIRQAYKLLGRTLPKTISIDLQLKEKIQKINADPAQIEQVLLNLAINAKDAMPEGGRLLIRTQETFLDDDYCKSHAGARPGKYILLTVTDTGQGMDEATLDHIFEPFYTTKGRGKGTGLGLAMVYGIVKGHGGYIGCYSKPGEGTSFEIYLPVIEQNDLIINQEEKSRDWVRMGRGEKVLVIDDDQAILDIVEKALSKFGYVVLRATDGRQGLQVYTEVGNIIDVVIVDYMMPEIDGIETLKEIRKIDPRAKIILASGYPLTKVHEGVIRDNVRGFLTKPFNIEEMLRQIRQVIDSP
ncbi:MAG: response regulator [Deltaproteobacteria bacterium]|nr:response regulator [Deltaproteobacteria bacterium]